MLIDTHCHIHDRGTYNFAFSRQQIGKKFLRGRPDFPHEIDDFTPEKIIARAHEHDVKKMICIGTSHEDSLSARDFAAKHADAGVFWSYGIHPDEATGSLSEEQTEFFALSSDNGSVCESRARNEPRKRGDASLLSVSERRRFWREATDGPERSQRLQGYCLSELVKLPVAIGEVGLDYRETTANRTAQIRLFERMLQLAKDNDLPLIFHVRDAFDDFFSVIANFPDIRGVVHSFSDSEDNLKKSLDKGFYIGVNGLATFAPELPTDKIPLQRMLLETDAPFLTPAPFRGTINEPARVQDVCAYISKINGKSEAEVAQITTKNAESLFKI
ncbi:TatD family hydrolase [Candidatus Saccharibacteria bacterium]|nr:TatD family hydrolase [Candidatus Saccharibacteria bacterium]